MPDITVTEADTIDLIINNAASIDVTVSEGSPISVNITEPAPQIVTVYPQLTINSDGYPSDMEEFKQLETDGLGDWYLTELENTSTSGMAFTANGMECELLIDGGRLWVDNKEQPVGVSTHNPTFDLTNEHDFLFTWSGWVDQFDTATSSIIVGFMRTHAGGSQEDCYERVVGFHADRATETWRASIWRPTIPDSSAYGEFWGEDTGLSIYDEHRLQVVVCNHGTRAAFFKDGDLISVQDDNLPDPADHFGGQGVYLLHGLALRNFLDDVVVPTVQPKLITTDMSNRKHFLDSNLTVEYGGGGAPSGPAGGDLSGTYPNPQIAAGVVGTTELTNLSISSIKLMTGSVTTAKILDGAVTPEKLAGSSLAGDFFITSSDGSTCEYGTPTSNIVVTYGSPNTVGIDLAGIAAGGDLQGTYPNPTVHKVHGVNMQAGTPTDGDIMYYHNAGAEWQHRSLSNANIAPKDATYIVQTSTTGLSNEQALGDLATGILKSTTSTGVLSIATGSDLPTHTHTLADISDFKETKICVESECNSVGEFTTYSNATGTNVFTTTGLGSQYDGHWGILRSGTAASSTAGAGIGAANTTDCIVFGTYQHETTAIVYIPTLSTGTDRFIVEHGFSDLRTGTPTDAVMFQYSDNINSGKWLCTVYNNNGVTTKDSGITVSAGTWYKLKVIVYTNGSAEFYIDGSLVGSTTDFPASTVGTGSSRACSNACTIRKTAGTTTRSLDIDYYNLMISTSR